MLFTPPVNGQQMAYIGVDGCRKGWLAVILKQQGGWEVGLYQDIFSLWNRWKNAKLILIDIPIGFRDNGRKERTCDLGARKLLGLKRGSSVFPVPCRAAVYTDSALASAVNKELTERGLSRQLLYILHKIKQVDQLLADDERAKSHIREVHPEFCFWALNCKHSMKYSKKDERGIKERKRVLFSVYPPGESIFNYAAQRYLRKEVTKDDILDAMAAAVTASRQSKGLLSIPESPEVDSRGLPMEMVYYLISNPTPLLPPVP